MKIHVDDTTNISSMEMEQHAMGLDLTRMNYIINMLTDAYKNPILAVIREYAANALDAQREAGNTAPIVVTLPTALAPNLIVQDEGIGLDLDGIINIYAQYGSSTKSENNNFIGGFGIGSKSAFAVAQHYTVTAVKDGVESQVIFARTSEGGTVNVLRSEETDKPNGVTVSVPIEGDYARYRMEAEKLFAYWSKADVIVHGADIQHVEDEYTEITDGIWVAERDNTGYGYGAYDGIITLRVGSIPYALDNEDVEFFEQRNFVHKLSREANIKVIFDVPIGSVDIPAHREKILLNDLSKKQVGEIIGKAREALTEYYTREITAAKNRVDATRIYLNNSSTIHAFTDTPSYKGKPLLLKPAKASGAVAGSELDRAGTKVSLIDNPNSIDYLWKNPKVPVIIIDKGTTKLEKGIWKKNSYTAEIEVTGEFFALVNGRKGKVRRAMSAFMRSLVEDNTFKSMVGTDSRGYALNKNFLYVYKHQLGRDSAVLAHEHKVYTIDEIQQIAKDYQAANRKQRAASGSGIGSGAFTYNTRDLEGKSKSLTVAEIVAHEHILYVDGDSHYSMSNAIARVASFAPKSVAIIVLTKTQSLDALHNRVHRADNKKKAVHYAAWVREQAVEAAKGGMSDAVALAIQVESDTAWKRIVRPLATKPDLLPSEPFQSQAKAILDTVLAVDEKEVRKWREIGCLTSGSEDRATTAWDAFLADYPVVEIFTSAIGWQNITSSGSEETLATFADVITALDTVKAGAGDDSENAEGSDED